MNGSRVVGILGGGQLGRMLAASASLLNVPVVVLDSGDDAPAKQVLAHTPWAGGDRSLAHIDGSFTDPEKILALARQVDVLTVEIEHVNVDVLEKIASEVPNVEIHPSPQTIRIIQDKFLQKTYLVKHNLPVADFLEVGAGEEAVLEVGNQLGFPLMLKSRTLAYDGRGNYVIEDVSKVKEAISALKDRPLYAERLLMLRKEIAVMVVRGSGGEIRSYPPVETVHKDNICHLVFAPFRSATPELAEEAKKLAEDVVRTFSGAGVFGVEMFLLEDGKLLINEIAPRPHNSGHYTIEACNTSQYANHLRAILSLPLGSTALKVPSACMLNLLGASTSFDSIDRTSKVALEIDGAYVHLYGKKGCRKGRKMGHITIVGSSDDEVRSKLRPLLSTISESDTETDLYAPPPPPVAKPSSFPLVGIIMGSDSDLPVMHAASQILTRFGVPYELSIVSAHRTPERMTNYARSAVSRGLRVIIAGAGGAAHLPGMVAAMTPLPVVGVPVKGSSLDGVDSMWSIVQMPRGVPVATVAINNSTNAALLAVRILGSHNAQYLTRLENYMEEMEKEVLNKVERLDQVGWDEYLKTMPKK